MYYRVGYKFKFGGGVGLGIAKINEKLSGLTKTVDYSTNGFGVILKHKVIQNWAEIFML